MASNTQRNNLHNMLYGLHCEVKFNPNIISRYEFNKGNYEIQQGEDIIDLTIISPDGFLNPVIGNKEKRKKTTFNVGDKIITHINYPIKTALYQSYLESCINAFEKEIEENQITIPTKEGLTIYLQNIYSDCTEKIEANKFGGLHSIDENKLTEKQQDKVDIDNIQNEQLTRFLEWFKERYIKFLPGELDIPSKKSNNKFIQNSFELNDKVNERFKPKAGKPITTKESVFREMLKELTKSPQPFIGEETTLPQFKKIFSGDEVVNIITWKGSVGELHYFINKLHLAKINDLHNNKWKVTLLCFTGTNRKGKPFTNTMLRSANKSLPIGQRKERLKTIVDLL